MINCCLFNVLSYFLLSVYLIFKSAIGKQISYQNPNALMNKIPKAFSDSISLTHECYNVLYTSDEI